MVPIATPLAPTTVEPVGMSVSMAPSNPRGGGQFDTDVRDGISVVREPGPEKMVAECTGTSGHTIGARRVGEPGIAITVPRPGSAATPAPGRLSTQHIPDNAHMRALSMPTWILWWYLRPLKGGLCDPPRRVGRLCYLSASSV